MAIDPVTAGLAGVSLLTSLFSKPKKITQPGTEWRQTLPDEQQGWLRDALARINELDPEALKSQYAQPYGGELNANINPQIMALLGQLANQPTGLQQGSQFNQASQAFQGMANAAPANIYDESTPEGRAFAAHRMAVESQAGDFLGQQTGRISEKFAGSGTLGSSAQSRSLGDAARRATTDVANLLASQGLSAQDSAANRAAGQQLGGAQGLAGLAGLSQQGQLYSQMNRNAALEAALRGQFNVQGLQQDALDRRYNDFQTALSRALGLEMGIPQAQFDAANQASGNFKLQPSTPAQTAYAPSTGQQIGGSLMNLALLYGMNPDMFGGKSAANPTNPQFQSRATSGMGGMSGILDTGRFDPAEMERRRALVAGGGMGQVGQQYGLDPTAWSANFGGSGQDLSSALASWFNQYKGGG